MGAVDVDRALAFVRANANGPVERGRLGAITGDVGAVHEAVVEMAATQRPDGGWPPFWVPNASAVDSTCFGLAQLGQLGVRAGGQVARATAFLAARQRLDGSFEEDAALAASLPPWLARGDLAATLYLTANAGFCLWRFGGPLPHATRASAYLRGHLDGGGRLPAAPHANWLAAGLLYGAGDAVHAADIVAYLRSRLGDLEASNLAWLVLCLRAGDMPAADPLIADARGRLTALQRPDGSWASEDGPAQDVHATLEALRALEVV